MRFDCGLTAKEKILARAAKADAEHARLCEWHTFFPLWPRRVGPHDCRWLEPIQRRRVKTGERTCTLLHGSGKIIYHAPIPIYGWEYRP